MRPRDPERFCAALRIDREGGRHNPMQTPYHVAPSGGRRVLSIADNPEPVPRPPVPLGTEISF